MAADGGVGVHHAGHNRQPSIRPPAGQRRDTAPQLVNRDRLIGRPVVVHVEHATTDLTQLGVGLYHVNHAAFGVHQVEVQLPRQLLIQCHRFHIERNALIAQVVGADGDRVAGNVAAAQPALFQHRHIGDAMLSGQVMRRGQPMPAGTDDQDFIVFAKRWLAPGPLPVLVVGQRVAGQREQGVALHGALFSDSGSASPATTRPATG